MAETFTTAKTHGGISCTTTYRRTSRTTTRVALRETAAVSPSLDQTIDRLKSPHRAALRVLRDLPLNGRRELTTLARRLRQTDLAPFADLSLLLDDLIELGLVIRESKFKAKGSTKVWLMLSPVGQAACEHLFGSSRIEARRLASLIEASLPAISRPAIVDLLAAHLAALRAGRPLALARLAGHRAVGPGHHRYETVLRFLVYIGQLSIGQSVEWKELAAELFPEIGGSKRLQGWQTFLEEILQLNLELNLAECGILTEETLYHVPLAGPLFLSNGTPLPGRFPALSNIDIAAANRFTTPAGWLLLVENPSVLLALGRRNYPLAHNCLVCCTDGMIKHALVELVDKLGQPPVVLWVDWDKAGLWISAVVRRRLPGVSLVPHPGLAGEPADTAAFVDHPDSVVAQMAAAIGQYGAVEQERALSQVLTWDLAGIWSGAV